MSDPVGADPRVLLTECCGVSIAADHRFCPKCGYEARTARTLPDGVLGDLLAYGRQQVTYYLLHRNRNEHQFWQGWCAALDRLAPTAAFAIVGQELVPRTTSGLADNGPAERALAASVSPPFTVCLFHGKFDSRCETCPECLQDRSRARLAAASGETSQGQSIGRP